MSHALKSFLNVFGTNVLLLKDGRLLVNDAATGIRSSSAVLVVLARASGGVRIIENGTLRRAPPDNPLFRRAASVLKKAYRRHIRRELRVVERSKAFHELLASYVSTALQGETGPPPVRFRGRFLRSSTAISPC